MPEQKKLHTSQSTANKHPPKICFTENFTMAANFRRMRILLCSDWQSRETEERYMLKFFTFQPNGLLKIK